MTDQNRDAQLTALRRQLDRRREAEAALCSLRSRRDALAAELAEQETLLQAEQADVARLEGQGLSTLFYRLTGRLEEQLEQEQQEATDAQVAYDAAAASLAETETELAWREQELAALADCEGQYRARWRKRRMPSAGQTALRRRSCEGGSAAAMPSPPAVGSCGRQAPPETRRWKPPSGRCPVSTAPGAGAPGIWWAAG